MPPKTLEKPQAAAVETRKMLWVGERFKKQDGKNVKLTSHTCALTSPPILFAPGSVDPDDPRPHALVPMPFGDYLVAEVFDETGEQQFCWADDPAAPPTAKYQTFGMKARRFGTTSDAE